jgi:hypothetical protein
MNKSNALPRIFTGDITGWTRATTGPIRPEVKTPKRKPRGFVNPTPYPDNIPAAKRGVFVGAFPEKHESVRDVIKSCAKKTKSFEEIYEISNKLNSLFESMGANLRPFKK